MKHSRRYVFPLLSLWLVLATFSHPARSQNATYPTRADTLRAVNQLFDAKQRRAVPKLAIGSTVAVVGAGMVWGIAGIVRSFNLRLDYGRVAWASLTTAGPGLLLAAGGLRQRIRYSEQRYQRIIADYQRGQPLPRYVRRALKPGYFY